MSLVRKRRRLLAPHMCGGCQTSIGRNGGSDDQQGDRSGSLGTSCLCVLDSRLDRVATATALAAARQFTGSRFRESLGGIRGCRNPNMVMTMTAIFAGMRMRLFIAWVRM